MQPLFQVEEKERGEGRGGDGGGERARNGNRSGVTHGDMRPKSPPPSLLVVFALSHIAWSLTPAFFALRIVRSLTPALHTDPGATC